VFDKSFTVSYYWSLNLFYGDIEFDKILVGILLLWLDCGDEIMFLFEDMEDL
jgi:hypothetical protein